MAGTISAFFSSLLPSYKGQSNAPTPGRFNTESGTTGSTSAVPFSTSSNSAYNERQYMTNNATSEGEPDAIDPQQLRNLRAQFLDQKFGPQGKKRRAGQTFTSPKGEESQA